MPTFVERRIVNPLLAILRQGTTPRMLACSLACGVVCGVFPVVGATTILCFGAAFLFRLNQPAAQLVNYLIYPLQLVLILPFIRAGAGVLRMQGTHLSLQQLIAIFRHDGGHALPILWRLAVEGIVAWALIAPFLFATVYWLVLPPIRRMARLIAERRQAAVVLP
ncbi:MAG TPA: DUF2062 domain-containing protein [Acidobacteriaceae bacterium]|jgi:uncharacterized protein (DUF2062 family)|nr:DUF2062 domain-containing protein [Acidobacteriaceae bacterium]